jgi:Ca2+-binding EF-hand superfamily protein
VSVGEGIDGRLESLRQVFRERERASAMGRTRTAMGQTNISRRSDSGGQGNDAGGSGRSPTQSQIRARDVSEGFAKGSPSKASSPARKSESGGNAFTYDTPKGSDWVDVNAPPTPDFDQPEKVIASNMLALKRCRHKLNVFKGGAKKYFLGWNTTGNGSLTREQMFKGFENLHLGFTQAQADFLVRAFDLDNSNSVEYHEFCHTMEMSDDDILKAVGSMSVIKPPPWIKPKGWKFNPHEERVARNVQQNIQERLHQTFGGNPRDIRNAFLTMDRERAGSLSKDDFVRGFDRIGVSVKPEQLDLLLASIDNKAQDHKVPYTTFVKNFESQPVGSFNPFEPTEKIPGTEFVSREQLETTGAPLAVQRKWNDSFGRDPRYRVSFPEVYRAKLRPESCPPDFSDNPDFELVDEWRQGGKTIGREISTLRSNKPIPPQESAQYRMRASRLGMTLPPVSSPGQGQTSQSGRDTSMMSPFGNKTKNDLVRDREMRFRKKQQIMYETQARSRATSALSHHSH